MKKYFHEDLLDYNGTQLSSLFAYRNFSVQGDSTVAFIGKCDVALEEMVDLADVKSKSFIYSESMLHFIIELFSADLEKAVAYQRLFTCIVIETINRLTDFSYKIHREGDDIYIKNSKLSVSIATSSPVSSMIHFGVNIRSDNTPVTTISLSELNINEKIFANNILDNFTQEYYDMHMARCKVRGVI